MNRLILAGMAVGLLVVAGCEEKPKAPAIGNTLKDAGNAMNDAAKKAGDSAKSAADSAKTAADKAVASGTQAIAGVIDSAKKEGTTLVDKAKGQLDQLSAKASTVAADKKPDFDKAMTDLSGQFTALKEKVTKLGGDSPDAIGKALTEIKSAGTKLMDGIRTTAEKHGIKLN